MQDNPTLFVGVRKVGAALIVLIGGLALARNADAGPFTYNIVTAQSQINLTLTGSFLGGALTVAEQFPTAITRYQGTLQVDSFPGGNIYMAGGSAAEARNMLQGIFTPNAQPGVGGSGSAAPANYAFNMSAPVGIELPPITIPDIGELNLGTFQSVDIRVAMRELVLDVYSGGPIARNPITGQFDASLLDLEIIDGAADIQGALVLKQPDILTYFINLAALSLLAGSVPDLGLTVTGNALAQTISLGFGTRLDLTGVGIPFPNVDAALGTVTGVGGPMPTASTLTIPIGATLPDLGGIPSELLDLNFSMTGQLVATGIIPEPSTWLLAVMGAVGVALIHRRRKNS